MIKKIPKLIRFLTLHIFSAFVFLFVLRLIFFCFFNNADDDCLNTLVVQGFYLGAKYDLRLLLLICFPVLLLAGFSFFSPFKSSISQIFWKLYFSVFFLIILIFYICDFAYYQYFATRLDATSLRFLADFKIAFTMLVESYPVFKAALLLLFFIILYYSLVTKLFLYVAKSQVTPSKKTFKFSIVFIFVFLYLFGIYGKFSYYPLRWSDAFFSNNTFISNLSLNPVLYFCDTLKNKSIKYDIKKTKRYYGLVANHLKIDEKYKDKDKLSFVRIEKNPQALKKYNVVFVLLESFAYYKTGLSKNPLNPSPNFDKIAKDGILFTRYYTPHGGTARSVFAAMTGIPDVEAAKTSSRNPLVVNQHTIISEFKGYEKFYFLGGSASWGEVRGLFSYNVPNIHIYEEGDYPISERVDVWGISDLSLFKEANKVLKEQSSPFFAFIHTSGNHSPFTIPKDNENFQIVNLPENKVKQYGFNSLAEYNAFRFMDHAIGHFINIAKKEEYFKNTIFAFAADHGVIRDAKHMHKSDMKLILNKFRSPFLIYAPFILEKKVYKKAVSEVDLMPTLASLVLDSYVNSTFGRNILDSKDSMHYAFTTVQKGVYHEIGLIGDEFVFRMKEKGNDKKLYKIYAKDDCSINRLDEFPSVAEKMENLTRGIYEAVKYTRYHNSKEEVENRMKELIGK